jgi:hypothetical protein
LELDTLAYAIDLLEADSSLLSQRMLLPYRLEAGQASQASTLLSAIDNWQARQEDIDENEDYHSLYGVVHALLDSPTTIHKATVAQRQSIRSVADSPFGIAGAAQAVLARIEGKRYTDWPDSKPAAQPRFSQTVPSGESRILAYPNPSQGEVWLLSEYPMVHGLLHDLNGATQVYPLGGTNGAHLQLTKPPGVYLLQVFLTDGRSESVKILIQK